MHHAINHVHIRSNDPNASAAWYTEHFGAKLLSSREVMPGTITITMDTGSPVRLNISSQREGESQERAVADINRLGLEHYGFDTDDIEADIAHFEGAGVRVVMPITDVGSGPTTAYIEGPADGALEVVARGSQPCPPPTSRALTKRNHHLAAGLLVEILVGLDGVLNVDPSLDQRRPRDVLVGDEVCAILHAELAPGPRAAD